MASKKSTTVNVIDFGDHGDLPCYVTHLIHQYDSVPQEDLKEENWNWYPEFGDYAKTAQEFLADIKKTHARIVTISLSENDFKNPLSKEVLALPCDFKVETKSMDGRRKVVFMVFVNQPQKKGSK